LAQSWLRPRHHARLGLLQQRAQLALAQQGQGLGDAAHLRRHAVGTGVGALHQLGRQHRVAAEQLVHTAHVRHLADQLAHQQRQDPRLAGQ